MAEFKKVMWMFPGQGGQSYEMLSDIPRVYFDILEEATELNFIKHKPDLSRTRDIQLALLLVEVYYAAELKKEGVFPDFVAGHSLGAFSAAVIAGVLDLKSAFELVCNRGELMQSLYPENYGMGVINGLTRCEVQRITSLFFSEKKPVYVSNQNEELQLTISGHWDSIDEVLLRAKQEGASISQRLNVPTPSHSPLMQGVAEKLSEIANSIDFKEPRYPYYSNCTGRMLHSSNDVRKDLIQNVIYPVKWIDILQGAIETGVSIFVELPPGRVLGNLVQRGYPDMHVFSIEQYGISDVAYLCEKWR